MTYKQLTLDERYQLEALRALGSSRAEIARALRRHPSTISRELHRNGAPRDGAYVAPKAAVAAHRRRVEKGKRSRKIQGALQEHIEQKLHLSWSPEQISGRLLLERGIRVSHETIYQHVLRDSRQRGHLRYCLRFGGYKHHRFSKSAVGERTRARKNWLAQRPAAANERTELGHWERDCVLGQRGRSALLTIVDRKSRYTRIRHVQKVDTKHVARATIEALAEHRRVTKTITNDNGAEFQRDEALQAKMRIPIFFTDPSSPWQRGSIENLNGLVRQYVPKGADMDKMPAWMPQALEETLNFRPRKTLGYRTPHEAFYRERRTLIANHRMHFGLEYGRSSCSGRF
jgi:IS30 family transposase